MSARPLVIAHRAGNSAEGVRAARAAGADLVEADVHLFRGRLEVRHAKTLGPLPRLWEKWYLLARDAPRPDLAAILAAVGQAPGLVLDLKGPDPRLPAALLASLAEEGVPPGTWICGRVWRTVDRLRGDGGPPHAQLGREPGAAAVAPAPIRLRALWRGSRSVATCSRPGSPMPSGRGRMHCGPGRSTISATADLLADWGVTGMVSDDPGRLRRG